MDYYLSDEVKRLKDWEPQLGDKFELAEYVHSNAKEGTQYEVRDGLYGIQAYRSDKSYLTLESSRYVRKVIMAEYTNLSDIKDIDKVVSAGTQLYYNDKSKYSNSRAGEFSNTFYTTSVVLGVRYTSGGWDKVEVLKVKTKDIKQMKYEDKWHLNDGKTVIPADADTLTKDGSIVAYRLPIKEPKVGDTVKVNSDNWKYKLLYIHQEDTRKWAVIAYAGDKPKSVKFEDIRLAD